MIIRFSNVIIKIIVIICHPTTPTNNDKLRGDGNLSLGTSPVAKNKYDNRASLPSLVRNTIVSVAGAMWFSQS